MASLLDTSPCTVYRTVNDQIRGTNFRVAAKEEHILRSPEAGQVFFG